MTSARFCILVITCSFWALSDALICNPSAVHMKECNICKCSEDGEEEICTKNLCQEVEYEDTVSVEDVDSYEDSLIRTKIKMPLEELRDQSNSDEDSYQ